MYYFRATFLLTVLIKLLTSEQEKTEINEKVTSLK